MPFFKLIGGVVVPTSCRGFWRYWLCILRSALGLSGVQKMMLVRTPAVIILWNKPLGRVLDTLCYWCRITAEVWML